VNKVMSMRDAITNFVKSGDLIFLSGAQHGSPTAAIAEILRQRIDHLSVVAVLSGGMNLIGEGLVDRLITGYAPLDEKLYYPLAKARSMGKFPIIEEYSHFGIALGLYAGYMGVPFLPTLSQIGSDMPRFNNNIRTVEDPFSERKVGAIKAIVPDIAIVHVQRSDAEGNAQKWGSLGVDLEGVNASKKVIVTTEKIVDTSIIRRDPNRTIISSFRVSAVVEQPLGAYPGHLAGCYNDAPVTFNRPGAMRDAEAYENSLKDSVYGVSDWNEYLENLRKTNGPDYFDKLKLKNPVLSEPIVSGF
jgi:glutaconate CoA-transferase, subunit A